MFKKILVGFDGSKHSRKALETGFKLAGVHGSELRIIIVIDTARAKVLLYDLMIIREDELRDRARRLIEKVLEEYRAVYKDIKVDYIIRSGHPVEEIIDETARWGAELLIIGAKGETDLKEIDIGSVASALIKNVNIPILIVK